VCSSDLETVDPEVTKEEKPLEDTDRKETSEIKEMREDEGFTEEAPEGTKEFKQKATSEEPRNKSMTSSRMFRNYEFRLGKSMYTGS
jgi:hypothetical protein